MSAIPGPVYDDMNSIFVTVIIHYMLVMIVEHHHTASIAKRYNTSLSDKLTTCRIVQTDVGGCAQVAGLIVAMWYNVTTWLQQHETKSVVKLKWELIFKVVSSHWT